MDCLCFQDHCHETFDFILRVKYCFDGFCAFFGEFVDSFSFVLALEILERRKKET